MKTALRFTILVVLTAQLAAQPGGASPRHAFPVPPDPYAGLSVEQIAKYRMSLAQHAVQTDSLIRAVTAEVSVDSVRSFIQGLQSFGTRYAYASTRDAVARWLYDKFVSFGFTEVYIDSFYQWPVWHKNVVAVLRGTMNPEYYIVTGGHHDSYSRDPYNYAPGADDNASGTAAVLETARAMKATGYSPEGSIVFITFGAEEIGLDGSFHYAAQARGNGMNIKLMINHDMISSRGSAGISYVNVNMYRGAEQFFEQASYVTATYAGLTANPGSTNSSGSDSYSFYQFGYPAIYFEEATFSPYYHSTEDEWHRYDMRYCAEIVKASAAMAVYSDRTPAPVPRLRVADGGDGASLIVRWDSNVENDVIGYRVRVGPISGAYDHDTTITDTSYVVAGLAEGEPAYIAVSAIDAEGLESIISEVSMASFVAPRVPSELTDKPERTQVVLKWNSNREEDLEGYLVHRKATIGDTSFVLLTPQPMVDTLFADAPPLPAEYYVYSVSAVDTSGNESQLSLPVKTRPVSMLKPLGVINETAHGTGEPMKPTVESVDSYHAALLNGLTFETVDINGMEKAGLAELGAYKAVLWHGNDYADFATAEASGETLRRYLTEFGGKVLIATYLPTRAFASNSMSPMTFGPGLMRDVLKIGSAENRVFTRFAGADALKPGYPNVRVDTLKNYPAGKNYITIIESIQPAAGGVAIYSYVSSEPDTSVVYGKLHGKSVGVEYIGPGYSAITLSFPLYFMEQEQASALVRYVLENKFGVVTAAEKAPEALPAHMRLDRNYPNPFNPATEIRFSIPRAGRGTLKVYDVLGRLAATLVDGMLTAGEHTAQWNAGASTSSGIYYYRLEFGGSALTGKMILLK